jgi:hypothetical protein
LEIYLSLKFTSDIILSAKMATMPNMIK